MPNTIAADQNLDRNVRHFAASRVWYKRGRRIASVQVVIAFGVPIMSALVLLFCQPDWKIWTSSAGISAAILDVLLLDRLQRSFRTNGANEQEFFDCNVLGLAWPTGLAGGRPTTVSTNHLTIGLNFSAYRDWYPDVSPISKELGALICQQCNSWWDAKLRKRYAIGLGIALAVVGIGLIALGFHLQLTIEQKILTIYSPIAPTLIWTVRELLRHYETAQLSERTEKLADATWKQALQEKLGDQQLAVRDLQDAIYYRRRTSPFVPTLIQKMQQQRYRATMLQTAADMVSQAREVERCN